MGFGEAISTCLGKYAQFDGRAVRSEYWWFYLFTFLANWAASIIGHFAHGAGGSILSVVVSLALLLPSLAAGVRRLHDTGRSGWWLLVGVTVIGLIPLVIWLAQPGREEQNQYS
jgi:uncharacterized membrane protein YhaH (DUF805 family)